MSLVHAITAGLLILMMVLQVKNFAQFSRTNGANLMRIMIFISTACMFIHAIRLMRGITDGAFFMMSVGFYLMIYFKSENQ